MRLSAPPRALLAAALLIVGLHVANAVYLGTSYYGTLIGNFLQIAASFLAAGYCLQASQRRPGFSQFFWILVGIGMAMWGFADLGWSYYESVLRSKPPQGSFVRFMFDTHGLFFVMAVLLDPRKPNRRIEWEEVLDFVQVVIVYCLIFFGAYYVPSLTLSTHEAVLREVRVVLAGDLFVVLLALVQSRRTELRNARNLLVGLAVFQFVYMTGAWISQWMQSHRSSLTGTYFDLMWTIPLLLGAFWAATWSPVEREDQSAYHPKRTLAASLLNNGIFALIPLIVLFQVAQLGPGWKLIRFSLLGLSFVCYALRLGLTEYRRQHDAETVQRQTLAMDSSVDGISILNDKGLHIYANQSFAQMLGFVGPEAVLGLNWQTVFSFQDMARLEPEVRQSVSRFGKWNGQFLLKRPDGRDLPVEMNITLMPDGSTACVCRDISPRQEAETARVKAETKYRMLVEQVNAITYIAEIGLNGQWYYVSPQVEKILGYSAEEWLASSHDWPSLIHPDDLPTVEAAESASKNGSPFQAEFRVRRKDGREIWLSDTAVVVQGSHAHPVMEGILVDITERKNLETQLQQSRKMEAVGRLAGGIAHDFNNLLTIITGYVDLALNRPSIPSEVRADIERIENASTRAAGLVRQLLAFSRKQVMQPKVLDLNAIVLNMDKLLRRLMDENIEMVTRVDESLGMVKADPAQVEQVIMNLVVNARDAMPKGGRLMIETANAELSASYAIDHAPTQPGRYVMLAVSDSGVGMSRETQAHIFEPFYTTKENGRGTGLGLSTVYGVVKQSGGYIWVYSEPGKGSTFKVYLPRVDATDSLADEPLANRGAQRGAETVLVVEDEPAVRELIVHVLSENGYQILEAGNPQEAEKLAADTSREIHLLLTDMVMPGKSGRELAVQINQTRPGIRVVYMSGYTDNLITHDGMLEEGLDFLQKPFTPYLLVAKVREALSRAAIQQSLKK